MPRSSGTYSPTAGQPTVTGTTISSTIHNALVADLGNEITNSIPRDGTAPPTANLPMGNFKHTGCADGTVDTDSATYGQIGTVLAVKAHAATDKPIPVDADEIPLLDSAASFVLKKLSWANLKAVLFGHIQNQSANYALAGGTASVATATPSPAYGAVAAGQAINLTMPNAATGVAMTLQVNAQAALPCLNQDGSFVAYPAGYKATWELNTGATTWILKNPPVKTTVANFTAVSAANTLTFTVQPNIQEFRSATLNSGVPQLVASALATLAAPAGATFGAPAAITSASATMAGTTTLTINTGPTAPIQIGAVIFQAGTRIGKVASLGTYVGGTGTGTVILDASATFTAQAIVIINSVWLAVGLMANGEAFASNVAGTRIDETDLISTTAIGAGSTSATTIYSTTSRTSQPCKVLYLVQIANPTVGTYSIQPEKVILLDKLASAGRSWREVTTQRVIAQSYRNLEPYEKIVTIVSSNATGFDILVNGVKAGFVNSSGTNQSVTFPVPSGQTYILNGGTILTYSEYY
jgi:hypothetical protein